MKAIKKAAVFSAVLLALSTTAFAQGAGGAGGGGAGGGGNGGGQGGAGMSTPNAGGTTGTTSNSKGSGTTKAPTRMPQNDPHAKGASDTAASSAQ
ncbi:MAG: hypothetical protein QOC89_915 [Paraburkholderia sp.]|nr:hypothetical protein [Paraburkholderia sp.]